MRSTTARRVAASIALSLLTTPLACAPRRAPAAAASPATISSLLGLLAADRSLADATMRSGALEGLASTFADDVVLLAPGAQVAVGVASARRLVDSPSGPARFWWLPLYGEVSADSTLGVTYGLTLLPAGSESAPPKHGKYIAVWRRTPLGWRIESYIASVGLPAVTSAMSAGARAPAVLPASGAAAEFARADREFAALAGRSDAADAFEAFAAPDAVSFPGGGDIAHGPAAIAARLRSVAATTAWQWAPVSAGSSTSGDLGWTVGESVIGPRSGQQGETYFGKYLTVWRRLPDGRIAYIADAGNDRPAPAR